MYRNNPPLIEALSGFVFFALFPGFVFYYTVFAYGYYVPTIYFGYFADIAIIYMSILVFLIPWWLPVFLLKISVYTVVFILFVMYVVFWSVFNSFLNNKELSMWPALVQSLQTVFYWVVLFFIGFFIRLDSIFLRRILVFSSIVMFLFLLFYVFKTKNIMFYAREISGFNEAIPSYQGFGRSALIVFTLSVVLVRGVFVRTVLAIGGVLVLFILGSRSELMALLICYGFLVFVWGRYNVFYQILVLVLLFFVSFIVVLFFDAVSESRHFQVFDISEASSWIARKEFQSQAVDQLIQSPIFGKFGGHYSELGSVGSYSHDILSAWVSYGFIGFFLYLILVSVPPIHALYNVFFLKQLNSPVLLIASLGLATLILVFVLKSVFWILPPLIWGFYANYLVRDRINSESREKGR